MSASPIKFGTSGWRGLIAVNHILKNTALEAPDPSTLRKN